MYFLFELSAKLALAKYILQIKVRFAKNITKRPVAENSYINRSKKNVTKFQFQYLYFKRNRVHNYNKNYNDYIQP